MVAVVVFSLGAVGRPSALLPVFVASALSVLCRWLLVTARIRQAVPWLASKAIARFVSVVPIRVWALSKIRQLRRLLRVAETAVLSLAVQFRAMLSHLSVMKVSLLVRSRCMAIRKQLSLLLAMLLARLLLPIEKFGRVPSAVAVSVTPPTFDGVAILGVLLAGWAQT